MKIEQIQNLPDGVLDELITVWEKAVRSSHHFLTEDDIAFFKPLVRNQYFPAVSLFAIRNGDGSIAAFMGLSGEMLEMLFVLPEAQGRGYGRALAEYAINQCHIYKVSVNEGNQQAYHFYLRMGYKVVGRDELDSTGKPFPILHLQWPADKNEI